MTTRRADVEFVQRINLNFQNLRQNGQDVAPKRWGKSEGSSTKVEKNLENRYEAESSNLGALLSNLPHELHIEMDSGKGPCEAYSLVGFLNSSTNKAHEITSPLKANGHIPNPSMKPVTLVSPKKETQPKVKVNLKRNAREKGKQAQITPTKTQVKLSGFKHPSRLDFSKETEGTPPSKKKLCVTQLNTPTHIPDGSAVSARQHHRAQ